MEKYFDDWTVQLAKNYKPGFIKEGQWFSISQKINGVRATYFAGNLISRTGHRLVGFYSILNELASINTALDGNYVFDGELRLSDDFVKEHNFTDNAAFKYGTGIVNCINDMKGKNLINFIIFDVINAHEWAYEDCHVKYKERLKLLHEIKRMSFLYVKVVPTLYFGYDINQIEYWADKMADDGYEGIMINTNDYYKYTRSASLLKYKKFNTIDLKCIGFKEGIGKYVGTLGAIVCEYKDNEIYVGSGFTDGQRNQIWQNQEAYYGRIAEIKYKDITSNKETGLESLQFPVFVTFREDKIKPDTVGAFSEF